MGNPAVAITYYYTSYGNAESIAYFFFEIDEQNYTLTLVSSPDTIEERSEQVFDIFRSMAIVPFIDPVYDFNDIIPSVRNLDFKNPIDESVITIARALENYYDLVMYQTDGYGGDNSPDNGVYIFARRFVNPNAEPLRLHIKTSSKNGVVELTQFNILSGYSGSVGQFMYHLGLVNIEQTLPSRVTNIIRRNIGYAFDNYFTDTEWESGYDMEGQIITVFIGVRDDVRYRIVYIVDTEEFTYEPYSIKVDDEYGSLSLVERLRRLATEEWR
jgi:hypothetical protein